MYEDISIINLEENKIIDLLEDRALDNQDMLANEILQNDIKNNGILNPLIFARLEDNSLEIICGRRRLEAIKNLEIKTIPVKILKKDIESSQKYLIAYSENANQKKLNTYAQNESLLLAYGIMRYNPEKKHISNSDMKNRFLAFVKKELVKFNEKNEDKKPTYNKEDIKTLEVLKELSKKVSINEQSLIKKMINDTLDYSLKKMVIENIIDINTIKKLNKTKKIEITSHYNNLVQIANDYNNYIYDNDKMINFKLIQQELDFFNGLEKYIDENNQVSDELILQNIDEIILFLVDSLKQKFNETINTEKESEKYIVDIKKDFNKTIKKMTPKQFSELKALLVKFQEELKYENK